MLKRKVITMLVIGMLALGACKPQATASPIAATAPAATSSPEDTATPAPAAASSTLIAILSELAGTVQLKHAGQAAFAPASSDATLEVNGQIQTGDDGRVRLDLSSGTIIRVAPSSLFTLTANEEVDGGLATKIKLELGKIFVILNGGSAEVETTSGVASVRGSYLSVETVDGKLKLTCLEGDCGYSGPAGDLHFTNGQSIILDLPGGVTLPEVGNMSPQDFQDWLNSNPEVKDLVNQALAGQGGGGQGGGQSNKCLNLIAPAGGETLPFRGRVKFQWEPQPGAQKYVITFKTASGNMISFETTETSIDKYIEIMPDQGDYSWEVTAYGGDGTKICTTDPATFSKPTSNWQPDPKPDQEEEPQPPMCNPQDPDGGCYSGG